MKTTGKRPTSYQSLDEIHERKDFLLDEIRKDNQQMKALWGQLFEKPNNYSTLLPSRRLRSAVTTGASIFDGILLGWKLYQKFKRKR